MSWNALNKTDLIIEVWEKLDCESVGATEIEAIEVVVEDKYGQGAIDPPMITARLLADEGAHLRHAELMSLHVSRASKRPYDAAFRAALKFDNLRTTLASLRDLENLRQKLDRDNDRYGLRSMRDAVVTAKAAAMAAADRPSLDAITRDVQGEISEWLRVWLQTPDVFDSWVMLRRRSPGFKEKFGDI